MRVTVVTLLIVASLGARLHAAAPSLTSIFPAGGKQGMRVEVQLGGKMEGATVLAADAGLVFEPPDAKGKSAVHIASDAPPGPHLICLANREGFSDWRWFFIGTLAEVVETEPNHIATQPQALEKLPVLVNGKLESSEDVDGFAFELKKDQEVFIHVDAYALGSPVDMLAHILDDKGTRIHTASDARNLDPEFIFKAPSDGRYTLQLAGFAHPPKADVRFTAGSNVIYRASLTAGPVVTGIFPPVVKPGAKVKRERSGLALPKDKTTLELDGSAFQAFDERATVLPPDALQPIEVLLSEVDAQNEKEPNNTTAEATPLPSPGVAGGWISSREDEDRFTIPVKKGQKLRAQIHAQSLGLPLDATLKVEDESGKSVATNDDQKDSGDPIVNWTASADGKHVVIVSDQFHRGGPNHRYVLEVGEPRPRFTVTLTDGKPLKLAVGKTVTVKAKVTLLDGWKEALVLRASGLPEGVHAPEVAVPEKGGDVTLTLHAAANVQARSSIFTVAAWTKADPSLQRAAAFSLRGDDQRGTSLSDRGTALRLTVTR